MGEPREVELEDLTDLDENQLDTLRRKLEGERDEICNLIYEAEEDAKTTAEKVRCVVQLFGSLADGVDPGLVHKQARQFRGRELVTELAGIHSRLVELTKKRYLEDTKIELCALHRVWLRFDREFHSAVSIPEN